ncbi:hypothetical protein X759_29360 [Mesorhizobium sp. LSHC420B00]|nr:hypothetical protein X759_29360 [Mesorhizobium sp. LSHC420B00]
MACAWNGAKTPSSGKVRQRYHVTMIAINSLFCRADFGLPLDWRERDFLFQARSNA